VTRVALMLVPGVPVKEVAEGGEEEARMARGMRGGGTEVIWMGKRWERGRGNRREEKLVCIH